MSFAAESGWPLIAVLALVLLVAVLGLSGRLLVVASAVAAALLVFWIYSLWGLV